MFLVSTVSGPSLNKFRGYVILKWRDEKMVYLFIYFCEQNPVERNLGMKGAKDTPAQFG